MKKVSIIIPCYNCQDLVKETLDSLGAQTFCDFEVICVNDGSTDDTLSVLERHKEACSLDMQIISKPNGGVSSARNAGIQAARGEYLLFLDADDLYHPTMIERLYNTITEQKTDVVYCWLSRDYDVVFQDRHDVNVILQNQSEAMHNLLHRLPQVGFYCYLYRREWIRKINLEFDVNTRHLEDREFNWKYLCHCQSVALVDAPLYYYRLVETSVTNSKTVAWRTDGLDAARRIVEYVTAMGCDYTPEVQSYFFPRTMWAMAKNYSLGGAKDAFDRLGREYDVKACMRRTAKDDNKLVALASRLYLIHPSLFYYIVRLKK